MEKKILIGWNWSIKKFHLTNDLIHDRSDSNLISPDRYHKLELITSSIKANFLHIIEMNIIMIDNNYFLYETRWVIRGKIELCDEYVWFLECIHYSEILIIIQWNVGFWKILLLYITLWLSGTPMSRIVIPELEIFRWTRKNIVSQIKIENVDIFEYFSIFIKMKFIVNFLYCIVIH